MTMLHGLTVTVLASDEVLCIELYNEINSIIETDKLDVYPTLAKAESLVSQARENNCTCLPNALNILAFKYYSMTRYTESHKLLFESEKLLLESKNLGKPFVINQVFAALNHIVNDDIYIAISRLQRAMKGATEIENLKDILNINLNLGRCYFEIGEAEKAEKLFLDIINRPEDFIQHEAYGYTLEHLSQIKKAQNLFEEASSYNDKALDFWTKIGHSSGLYYSYFHKSEFLDITGDQEERLSALKKAQNIGAENNLKICDVSIAIRMGDTYSKLGHLDSMEMTYLSLLNDEEIKAISANDLKTIIDKLHQYYDHNKNTEKYRNISNLLVDNAFEVRSFNVENIKHIKDINEFIDKQMDDFEVLNKKNIGNQKLLKLQKWITGILFAGLIMIGLFFTQLYRANKYKKKTIKKIVSQNEKLKELNDALDIKNGEMERFAYITSHDIKAPLNTINSLSQLATSTLKSDKNANISKHLHYIHTSSSNLIKLTDDLLDYARLTKVKPSLSNIRIDMVIRSVLKDLESTIKHAGAEVTYTNTGHVILSDGVKLKQILQNLITNAIKFHKKGEQPLIEITTMIHHDQYHISVKDNGIGIDRSYYTQIFDMFNKLNPTDSGTGIGLATVAKLINTLGGKITLHSQVNIGSTFTCILPKR